MRANTPIEPFTLVFRLLPVPSNEPSEREPNLQNRRACIG
jgi:hypothetical protein